MNDPRLRDVCHILLSANHQITDRLITNCSYPPKGDFFCVRSWNIFVASLRTVSDTFLFMDSVVRSWFNRFLARCIWTSSGQRGLFTSARNTEYCFMNLRFPAMPRRTLSCTFFMP